jgi:hypothetical protein
MMPTSLASTMSLMDIEVPIAPLFGTDIEKFGIDDLREDR